MYVRILCVCVYLMRLQAAQVATTPACVHPATNGCSLTPPCNSHVAIYKPHHAHSSELVRNDSFVALETTVLMRNGLVTSPSRRTETWKNLSINKPLCFCDKAEYTEPLHYILMYLATSKVYIKTHTHTHIFPKYASIHLRTNAYNIPHSWWGFMIVFFSLSLHGFLRGSFET